MFIGGSYCINLDEQANILRKIVEKNSNALSSIKIYTTPIYKEIQNALKNPEKEVGPITTKIINNINKLFEKMSNFNKPLILFRGIKLKDQGDVDKYLNSQLIIKLGYTSTTTDIKVINHFTTALNNVDMIIFSSPDFNYKILPIKYLSSLMRESEVLLPIGTQFLYLNDFRDKINLWSTKLHEVPTKLHEVSTKLHEVSTKLHEVSTKTHEVPTKTHEVSTKLHEVPVESNTKINSIERKFIVLPPNTLEIMDKNSDKNKITFQNNKIKDIITNFNIFFIDKILNDDILLKSFLKYENTVSNNANVRYNYDLNEFKKFMLTKYLFEIPYYCDENIIAKFKNLIKNLNKEQKTNSKIVETYIKLLENSEKIEIKPSLKIIAPNDLYYPNRIYYAEKRVKNVFIISSSSLEDIARYKSAQDLLNDVNIIESSNSYSFNNVFKNCNLGSPRLN